MSLKLDSDLSEMQKVASVASGACAIFFPSCANFWAVYAQLDHPAQIIACTIKHSCANFQDCVQLC